MSIRSNIEAVMAAIQGGDTALGDEIRSAAAAAIKNGEGSPEWLDYMSRFGSTPDEVARLTPTDDTVNDPDMDLARASLVGNGTCGAATTGLHLLDGVEDTLDEGL